MVEYLSGGRIQGSSTATATATYEPELDNNSASKWVIQDSGAINLNTSNSRVDFSTKRDNSNNTLSYDLGSNLSATWVLRYKFNASTFSESENSWLTVGFRSVDSATPVNDGSTNFDAFGCFVMNGSSLSSKKRLGMHSATASNNLTEHQNRLEGVTYSTSTDYYVEVVRTGTTTGTVTFRTGSHTGTVFKTYSYSGGNNATNLRYLTISDLADNVSGDSTLVGTITDIEIYDNATSTTTDEKTTLTNVPDNTRYEETDTRKIYRRVTETIDGSDLKVYIKFDDSSGSPTNDAGNVTGNDSLGTAANITLTGTGTTLYDQTGTPSKLGNAMEFPATSSTSGVYGDFGTSTSQFNFLHGGTPTWTIAFWYKTSTAGGTNRAILRSAVGDSVAGITIYFYSNNLRVYIAKTGGGNNQPINSNDNGSDFTSFSSDGNWHFYVITMDFNLTSQTLKMSKDDGARTTANKSANACSSISTNSDYALGFRHSPSNGSGFIPPTAQMAELSIWNRVLTDEEITTLYNSGSGFQLDTGDKVWKERNTA
mgnify:FL=1